MLMVEAPHAFFFTDDSLHDWPLSSWVTEFMGRLVFCCVRYVAASELLLKL